MIPTRMTCSICGKVHKFDFEVPNEMWEECIIERYRKSPVCLECFTTRADERLLKWDEVIKITVPCSLATQIEIQNEFKSVYSNAATSGNERGPHFKNIFETDGPVTKQ